MYYDTLPDHVLYTHVKMGNDWEEHKSTIKRYWILEKMKLEQVAIVMREKHGFDKKCGLNYEGLSPANIRLGRKPMKRSSVRGATNSARIEGQRTGKRSVRECRSGASKGRNQMSRCTEG